MELYLKKVVGLLTAVGYDADTISRILGVSAEMVKEVILIINEGGSHNG